MVVTVSLLLLWADLWGTTKERLAVSVLITIAPAGLIEEDLFFFFYGTCCQGMLPTCCQGTYCSLFASVQKVEESVLLPTCYSPFILIVETLGLFLIHTETEQSCSKLLVWPVGKWGERGVGLNKVILFPQCSSVFCEDQFFSMCFFCVPAGRRVFCAGKNTFPRCFTLPGPLVKMCL